MTTGRIPSVDGGIQPTIIDAAGDLIYGASNDTPARLAIGTAGQVLKVNSGATAPEWATPAAPSVSDTWTLLSTTAMSGLNTVTISGITSKKLVLQLVNANHASTGQDLMVRPNNSTTASHYRALVVQGTTWNLVARDQTDNYFDIGRTNTSANINMWFTLDNCNNTDTKMMSAIGGSNDTGNTRVVTKGSFNDGTAITSITVLASSGNFSAGTLNVYGAS